MARRAFDSILSETAARWRSHAEAEARARRAVSRFRALTGAVIDPGIDSRGTVSGARSAYAHADDPTSRGHLNPPGLADLARELSRTPGLARLHALRRIYAAALHPDRAGAGDREQATRDMQTANAWIDNAIDRESRVPPR